MQNGSYNTHLLMLFKRTAALGYDLLAIIAIWMLGTALLLPFHHGLAFPARTIGYQLYLLSLAYLFFVGFWMHGGQTIGMMAWRLTLQSETHTPLTLKESSLRFLGLLLAIPLTPIVILSTLFNYPMAYVQDKLSATRCVQYSAQSADR